MLVLDAGAGVIRWGLVGAGSVCEVRLCVYQTDRSQISHRKYSQYNTERYSQRRAQ